MTLTDAPKDLGGRLRRNCALTTPLLPKVCQQSFLNVDIRIKGPNRGCE